MITKLLNRLRGPGGIKPMMQIAFPLMISTSTVAIMLFIDRLYLRQVSQEAMNASLSGGFTSFAFQSFFIGIIGFSTALVSQNYGARQFHNCPRVLTQTIVFSCCSVPLILALIPAGRWVLAIVGLSDGEVLQAQTYLTILMAGTGLDLFRNSLNSYFGGLGQTKVVLLATFVMAIANVSANYILIFGKLGFPALGIEGAAYGTVFAWFTGLVTLCAVYLKQIRFPEFQLLDSFQFDLEILKKLVRFGFASGLEIALLIFAIDLMILTLKSYGADVSTAITVGLTWIQTLHIPVIGLEIGTMSLVGRFIGARDTDSVSDSVFSGLLLASSYASIAALAFLFATDTMVLMFLESDSSTTTLNLAIWGTQLNAFIIFVISWSGILGGALRGAGDTYGAMTIFATFWWFQFFLMFILVRLVKLAPDDVLAIHVFSSPLLLIAMMIRFRSGVWRKFDLTE